uniref:hypothetical protein n=1 Tax=Candidatus Albibeggiatoa sp. nov. BB20 TaxID=3162723 RepID=UPI003365312F
SEKYQVNYQWDDNGAYQFVFVDAQGSEIIENYQNNEKKGESRHPQHPPRGEHKHPAKRGNHPPPEAYTACKGRNTGDTAQFKDHRGETMIGICEDDKGKLVLRPYR